MRFARLPEGPPSIWRLRNAPEEHMLCTLEAASRAVALAGDPRSANAMLDALRIVEAHGMHARGMLTKRELEARLAELRARSDEASPRET